MQYALLSVGARPTEPHPPKNFTWGPLIRKQNGISDFTQNEIFIRFCMSCIFVRFLMKEPDTSLPDYSQNINFLTNFSTDGYVFTQNAIAFDFAFTYPSSILLTTLDAYLCLASLCSK